MIRFSRLVLFLAVLAPGLSGRACPARADDPDHFGPAAPARVQELADSVRYAIRVTNNNLMGLTISNYGFIGNNFTSRAMLVRQSTTVPNTSKNNAFTARVMADLP